MSGTPKYLRRRGPQRDSAQPTERHDVQPGQSGRRRRRHEAGQADDELRLPGAARRRPEGEQSTPSKGYCNEKVTSTG